MGNSYQLIDFNPLPSCEGRPEEFDQYHFELRGFQSTPLMRGETGWLVNPCFDSKISIHSPHARGDNKQLTNSGLFFISIHSPHARGDYDKCSYSRGELYFNPLPSCEGRHVCKMQECCKSKFQSTPLMRGETLPFWSTKLILMISIHSPHARGDDKTFNLRKLANISIHSPHARGDCRIQIQGWGETISIHSPHARGDGQSAECAPEQNISIHSPHARGDSKAWITTARPKRFQSTPLMRGETIRSPCAPGDRIISIHSPHARGDIGGVFSQN